MNFSSSVRVNRGHGLLENDTQLRTEVVKKNNRRFVLYPLQFAYATLTKFTEHPSTNTILGEFICHNQQ